MPFNNTSNFTPIHSYPRLNLVSTDFKEINTFILSITLPRGGGILPYMGYVGMCGPQGYGFSAVLVINRVSILADFGHFGHK